MRRQAKASPARSPMTIGRRPLGLACLCLLALAAIAGPGAASAAESCPNAKYRTGPSLFLPECRAYELVTPQGKTNFLKLVSSPTNNATFTNDGDTALYLTATGPLTEEASYGGAVWERARRTATGWKAESATPPIAAPYSDTGSGYPRWAIPSTDLDKIFFMSSTVYDPDQTFTGNTLYNGGVHISDGKTDTWVSRPTWAGAEPAQGAPGAEYKAFVPLAGSPDLSTVYFNSFATLTPADGSSGRGPLQSMAVYKYENGQLSNAGVLPDGTLSPGGSVSADRVGVRPGDASPVEGDTDAVLDHPVSRDGKSLLFVSPDPARVAADPSLPKPQLYLAVDGRPSVLISAPEGGGEPVAGTSGVAPTSDRMGVPGNATSAYAVATPDHSVVLFSTKDALTSAAEAVSPEITKTYRYETATGALAYLPDLNRTGNAKQGQIVELSESGESMLYLTEGGSLRLWRKGKPTLTISEGVSGQLSPKVSYITYARFSEDEGVLALNSTGPLRGETNQTPGAFPETYRAQVYRYTVASDDLECISCTPGGTPNGAVLSSWGPTNGYSAGTGLSATGDWPNRSMTADGSTIYFTTATALVEADHNTVADVYQWHEGQLRLITTGATGADPSQAYGTTPSGRDVFIISDSRLSEADTDDLYDIYDVRVDGGFDLPGAGAACSGEACQGPPPPVPAAPVTGSASVDGRGNLAATARPFRATAPKKVIGRAVVVRLRVPSAGRVTANARFVKKTARVLSKAGGYRIKAALTAAGKRKLRQGSSLTTQLRVTFTPGSGATTKRTVQVTFKQPKAKKTRAAHGRKGR